MNDEILIAIFNYCKKYNVQTPSIYSDGVIDPGVKSPKSITDKVVRKVEIEDDKNFKLYNISDYVRGTIIVPNYSVVANLILSLKKEINNLYGYISSWTNGYRGIHLNFSIDGINAEIQIHTPESFAVTKATSEVYACWRNYNPQKEIETLLDLKAVESPLYEIKKAEFWHKQSEYAQANKDTRALYEVLWNNVDYIKFEQLISAIMHKIDKNSSQDERVDRRLQESLYADLIDSKTGLVNRTQTFENAKFISLNSVGRQVEFVSKLKNIYNQAITNDQVLLLPDEIEKSIIRVMVDWDNALKDHIKQFDMDLSCIDDYCSFVNLKKFNFISNVLEYKLGEYSIVCNTDDIRNNARECAVSLKEKKEYQMLNLSKII